MIKNIIINFVVSFQTRDKIHILAKAVVVLRCLTVAAVIPLKSFKLADQTFLCASPPLIHLSVNITAEIWQTTDNSG
jgi:hypothetical protein